MNKKYREELMKLLVSIRNPKLMDEFLEDLLTPAEFEDISVRWQIIKLLSKRVPQREIAGNLGVSIAKITRGSRELLNEKGGFWKILKNYKVK
ncbi:MAG: transcriptional regulator [Candidatus Taylorbacteria bacterium]|nr:transcriptional regulator [Candidatus Taylorbacteria bacterium]